MTLIYEKNLKKKTGQKGIIIWTNQGEMNPPRNTVTGIVHASGSIRTVRHRFITRKSGKTRYETGFMLGISGISEYLSNPRTVMENQKKTEFLLPLCSECKKIKDEHGNWIETDLPPKELSSINVTHILCPMRHKALRRLKLFQKLKAP
jgi:hypothetical protein